MLANHELCKLFSTYMYFQLDLLSLWPCGCTSFGVTVIWVRNNGGAYVMECGGSDVGIQWCDRPYIVLWNLSGHVRMWYDKEWGGSDIVYNAVMWYTVVKVIWLCKNVIWYGVGWRWYCIQWCDVIYCVVKVIWLCKHVI